MTTADVTFVIDGNDAGLSAAVSRGVRNLRRLDDEMDEVRASTAQADSAMRGFAGSTDKGAKGAQGFTLSAEKMGQGLSLVSPRLGELTAKIGGLGAAGGPLVAAAAGATAFGAAWAGVVMSMVDAIRNIDDLTEALTEQQRVALDPYIDNIEALRDVFDSIGGSLTETEIRLLSGFANGVSEIAAAVSLLANAFNRLDDASRGGLSDWIGRMLAGQNPLVAYAAAYGSEVTPGEGAATPGMGPLVDEPTAPGNTFNMEEDVRRRMAAARAGGRSTSSNRPTDGSFADITSLFAEMDAQIAANAKAADDAAFAAYSEQWDARVKAAEDGAARILAAQVDALNREDAYRTAVREHEAEMLEASQVATMQAVDLTLSSIASVAAMLGSLTDSQLAADESRALSAAKTEEQRERIRKDFAMRAWRADKAQALAQAAIQIPLSVLTGLSQGGPVLAAVNGALAAIQLGVIAATPPPKFHVGGMAPDERMNRGVIMRDNEATAVLTAQGRQSITPDILALANAGMLGRATASNVTVVVDGRPARTRPFATNPSTGIARR